VFKESYEEKTPAHLGIYEPGGGHISSQTYNFNPDLLHIVDEK